MRPISEQRVFFALWPEDGLRNQLESAAQSIPLPPAARRVPDCNLHLTLHFIGNVDHHQGDCLRAAASRVEAKGFAIDIDCQGYFRKPRVAWLGCRRIPAALLELQGSLGQELRGCNYEPESRPYNPHVTVIRKSRGVSAQPLFDPMRWPVDRFVLVESRQIDNGVQYEVIESYPLQ